jgi:hypothetical protein
MATAIVSIKPGAGTQAQTQADQDRKASFVWPADDSDQSS